MLGGVFCGNISGAEWCSSQCVHSSGCKGNLRLSSWSLLAGEIGFKGLSHGASGLRQL